MAYEKKGKDGALDDIVDKLADNISMSSYKDGFIEHLPYFDVKFGVVKGDSETYVIKEVTIYPSVEIETGKAVSYSIRSNGLERRNGDPIFYDSIKITGCDGKDAKIKGKYGDVIGFLERLYVALMIIFKPDVLVKKTGLKENNSKYQAAMRALDEYNNILEQTKEVEESEPELVDKKIEYFEVHGEDLLKKIADYKISG